MALTVNPTSREEVRQFYRGIYFASQNVPMNWTGSYVNGNAGDTSAAFKEATRLRINFYRALVGVPAGITFNSTFSAKAQQAALMMSANNTLDHFPPPSWTFYAANGAEAAGASNLAIGQAGPDAISGYMADAGVTNASIGHRRWLMYPQTRQMGTGDVPGVTGNNSVRSANAVWILDTGPGQFGSPRPTTRATVPGAPLAIVYPPAGYIPYTLVWPRWSFSYPGADFSNSTVTMTRNGQTISVILEPLSTSAGEPAIVWAYDGRNTNLETPHPRPAADTTYAVTVNNVRIAGAAQNFAYSVIVFDPDVAGPDFAPVAVVGTSSPTVGAAASYSVARPAFTAGFDWRSVRLEPFAKTFTAETGMEGLIATTTAGYDVVQPSTGAAGSAVYRLAHLTPRSTQELQLPDTYLVSGSDSAVSFRSRLGISTAIQTARVEVSTDEGVSWIELFTQSGTSATDGGQPQPTEAAFVNRSISLGGYVGRTVQVRLVFTINPSGIAFLPEPNNGVGWFIDNLTLSSAQRVNAGSPSPVATGSTFSYAPAIGGAGALQARGVLFGYPLEWGTLLPFNATSADGSNPGRLANLSISTEITPTEESFTVGYVVAGTQSGERKPILMRAAGPSLVQFDVGNVLEDPRLEFFAEGTKAGENNDWGGGAQLTAAMVSVGAFAYLGPRSLDAAVLADIATPNNTIQISSANRGTGNVIAELYDSTPNRSFGRATPRLANVSVLKHLGEGLTAGFVVDGSTPITVLIRAIGPGIAVPPFSVDGAVNDPQLTLFSGGEAIASNNDWGGTAELRAVFARVAAFELSPGSRDAALVRQLQPGSYTVTVTGNGTASGVALVEIYEVPTP